MKINTILSFVIATLATKAAANCFSSKYGYPCCSKNTDVLFSDVHGDWGVKKVVICGIEGSENTKKDKVLVEKRATNEVVDEKETVAVTVAAPPKAKSKVTVVKTKVTKTKVVKTTKVTTKKVKTSKVVKTTKVAKTKTAKVDDKKGKIDLTNYIKKITSVITTFPTEAVKKLSDVKYPTVEKLTYYSKTTETERPLDVILPANYSKSKKYPVLYYLHGIMTDQEVMLDDEIGTVAIPGNLLKEQKAKEMIIVLPYQYAPAPGTEVEPSFTQEYYDGYDNFINDLINDIMPYMKKHYSIATGRENTAILGFSMGGRNSLYIGYTRSDIFGWVGAISPCPGVTPGEDMMSKHKGLLTEDEFRAKNPPILTMLCSGTADAVVGDFPKSYHEILTRNNQEHYWYEIPGSNHDTTAIAVGYYNFISSVFGALN